MEFQSPEHAKAILEQIAEAKHKRDYIPKFHDDTFPKQRQFIFDDSPLQAVQCTRRAGKSEGIGRKQLKECFRFPSTPQLYIGLTYSTVRNILWNPILKKINRDLDLGASFNDTRLEMTLPNQSQIILLGADADPAQMEKFLGGKYRSATIDEAGSFRQNLEQMVYEMLLPAVSDYDGWIAMCGTPTQNTNSFFYKVCDGQRHGWSLHKWMTQDNPYMKEKFNKQIAMLLRDNPRVKETPFFRRMYLNEWVIDLDALCYKYEQDRNEVDVIPDEHELNHVIGVDLGFNDATAFSVLAYGEYDPNCYVRFCYKKSGMIISDVAARIEYFIKKYDPLAIVIDNASKQAVEELKQKFSLPLIAAEKQGKAEFIEIMNSDFILGNIKLLPEAAPLKQEYGSLIWDEEKKPKLIEHPSCENHCADATLYGYRYCYQYRHQTRPKEKKIDDKIDEWFDAEAERLEREDRGDYLGIDYDDDY